MKIHSSWYNKILNLEYGKKETDRYIISSDSNYFPSEKTIISIGFNDIKPRVDMYFPLGTNILIEYVDSVNNEPIARNILCSSQYNIENNRTTISGDFITEIPYSNSRLDFLRNLKSSMYCISPHGHMPDCFRHWEAMYMGCIPITLKHYSLEDYYDMPILFLDSWDELTEELLLSKYEELTQRFGSKKLEVGYWLEKLEQL